jgi:hypothetical protein
MMETMLMRLLLGNDRHALNTLQKKRPCSGRLTESLQYMHKQHKGGYGDRRRIKLHMIRDEAMK